MGVVPRPDAVVLPRPVGPSRPRGGRQLSGSQPTERQERVQRRLAEMAREVVIPVQQDAVERDGAAMGGDRREPEFADQPFQRIETERLEVVALGNARFVRDASRRNRRDRI